MIWNCRKRVCAIERAWRRAKASALLCVLPLHAALATPPESDTLKIALDPLFAQADSRPYVRDPQPYVTESERLKALAKTGNPYAQYKLSLNYTAGIGVSPDDAEAVCWLKRSAAQNYPAALYELGSRHEQGHGVAKNRAEAVRLYQLAATRGEDDARVSLERLGEEVPAAADSPPQRRWCPWWWCSPVEQDRK